MKRLGVLYACDENYAPWAGISMYSLFENNKDIDALTVYCVTDRVSDASREKLADQAARYKRELIFVDATEIVEQIKALNIPSYRGSYTTNFRLFFHTFVREDIERLLYVDCDTVVTGSLAPLQTLDMGDKVVGVVRDSLTVQYKTLLGFSPDEPYFNAGILLIDVPKWKEQQITQKTLDHIQNVRARYCNPDQDLLNLVLKDHIYLLSPAYNLQPHHLAFSDKTFFAVYKPTVYYTHEELEVARKSPVIYHAYRFLGDFPWHKGNKHPANALFDKYTEGSPWRGLVKKPSAGGLIFKLEKLLYVLLPRRLFLSIFRRISLRGFNKRNQLLQQGKEA
ncbi:MAG: glycosyltransferase family 8 protein [Clostridia bacterium]|nr:glycosyltransferase family 8 protein [Clostridia bacterium]